MSHQLPAEIAHELDGLVECLAKLGLRPVDSRCESLALGKYHVDFDGLCSFRIAKDHSQFSVIGPDWQALEEAGLRRSFESLEELGEVLVTWIKSESSDPSFVSLLPKIQFSLRRTLSFVTWLCIAMGLHGIIRMGLYQGRDPALALVGASFASIGATIGALFGKPVYGAGIVLGVWFLAILFISR